jgi:hypothetical protein
MSANAGLAQSPASTPSSGLVTPVWSAKLGALAVP